MSQFWQTYFSSDSQITALNAAITSNATDVALVATYQNDLSGLFTALQSADATALATPNSTNLNAVVTARQNLDTQRMAYAQAATIADQAVNGKAGTIMTRTVSLIQAALTDAIAQLNAAIVSIGYSTSVTIANAALRDSLAQQVAVANTFSTQSSSWSKPGDFQPAVNWLVN